MKKTTTRRLLENLPGSRVSFAADQIRINGTAIAAPPGFAPSIEIGILLVLPRIGAAVAFNTLSAKTLGRFAAPSIVDAFEKPSTLRNYLGLKELVAGEYRTPIEPGLLLARPTVETLHGLQATNDWETKFMLGFANGMVDALINGIPISGAAGEWAGALIEAAEMIKVETAANF